MTDDSEALPLNALRAFCEVARLQHVTRAADSLGVAQSAISRHVSHLEAFMGAPLLERQGRNIVLTEVGRQLAAAVSAPLNEIAFSVQLMRQRRSGLRRLVVRISLPTFAFTTLIPRLPEFSVHHDNIPVDILTSATPQDLLGDFDVLISRDLVLPPPMREWRIADEHVVCVGAPSVVQSMSRSSYWTKQICTVNSRPDILPTWLAAMGMKEEVSLGARYAHHYMALPAIVAGGGLLVAPEIVVSDYIKKQLLMVVEGSRVPTGMTYSAFANDRSPLPDLSAAFCRWVVGISKE